MQDADADDLEDQLFGQGVGRETLDSWVAKEVAYVRLDGQPSVLNSSQRRLFLNRLVALSDLLVMCASSRSTELADVAMKKLEARSLAVAIFYRLDDRALLGAVAALRPNTVRVQQLQQQELQRSCWALAWLGVKICSGNRFERMSRERLCPQAPPGTAERELEILQSMGWAAWCPSLFSWTGFFWKRLLATQRTVLSEQTKNDLLNACLSMVCAVVANPGESQQLVNYLFAGGIFYLAFRQVCMTQGIANSVIENEVAALVWVTGIDQETLVDSAHMASTQLMASYAMAQHHAPA